MAGQLDLNAIIGQIGRDKGIDKKILIEAVESAVLSAARKHYGHNLNLEAQFSEESGEVEVIQFRVVVEKVEDTATQISLEEARVDDPEAIVGDEIGKKLDTQALGRIAAQTAKQVIIQKVRDAERGVIFEEYKGSKGELVNGIVQRMEKGSLIVNLGRTDAVLPRREQVGRERYNQGDRIRCMILDIDPTARGPQIILTRSHPDFVRKLFSVEVPEIQDGVIEVKACAREAGDRTKIAVHSKDGTVDPVGACVGVKGARVQAVRAELKNEQIDVIPWTPDEPLFVARALAPVDTQAIQRVVMDEDNRVLEVIIADDQLALAIGRRGTNVKLASKLTGWRIDVRSVSMSEEESKQARLALESIPGLQFTHAELLYQAGYRSVQQVADVAQADLAEVEGFTAESAAEIIKNAKIRASQLEAEEEGKAARVPAATDLDKLSITPELRGRLLSAGFTTIQSVVQADRDLLSSLEGIGEAGLEAIRAATDTFLRVPISSKNRGRPGMGGAGPALPTIADPLT